MDIAADTPCCEHHTAADELALTAVDLRGVWLQAPDGTPIGLSWDELRAEAACERPGAGLFRDLLARAEARRRAN